MRTSWVQPRLFATFNPHHVLTCHPWLAQYYIISWLSVKRWNIPLESMCRIPGFHSVLVRRNVSLIFLQGWFTPRTTYRDLITSMLCSWQIRNGVNWGLHLSSSNTVSPESLQYYLAQSCTPLRHEETGPQKKPCWIWQNVNTCMLYWPWSFGAWAFWKASMCVIQTIR